MGVLWIAHPAPWAFSLDGVLRQGRGSPAGGEVMLPGLVVSLDDHAFWRAARRRRLPLGATPRPACSARRSARRGLLRLQRLWQACVGRRHGACKYLHHLHSPACLPLLGERLNGRGSGSRAGLAGCAAGDRPLLAPASRATKRGCAAARLRDRPAGALFSALAYVSVLAPWAAASTRFGEFVFYFPLRCLAASLAGALDRSGAAHRRGRGLGCWRWTVHQLGQLALTRLMALRPPAPPPLSYVQVRWPPLGACSGSGESGFQAP